MKNILMTLALLVTLLTTCTNTTPIKSLSSKYTFHLEQTDKATAQALVYSDKADSIYLEMHANNHLDSSSLVKAALLVDKFDSLSRVAQYHLSKADSIRLLLKEKDYVTAI